MREIEEKAYKFIEILSSGNSEMLYLLRHEVQYEIDRLSKTTCCIGDDIVKSIVFKIVQEQIVRDRQSISRILLNIEGNDCAQKYKFVRYWLNHPRKDKETETELNQIWSSLY